MKTLLAIDPGTDHSGYVLWKGGLTGSGDVSNEEIRHIISGFPTDLIAIEMVASYGMPVGREVFETVRWIGRFEECAYHSIGAGHVQMVYRKDVKIHLCNSAKAKDANIRQALLDKYGPVGTKKNPGPLYGISGHLWAALAVADYALSTTKLTL